MAWVETGAGAQTRAAAIRLDGLTDLVRRLEVALGGGPPVLPTNWPAGLMPLPGTAVAVATSGSTGQPKWVCLSAAAIRASAQASAARLGGVGRWLLALPTDHIAGLNVVIRSILAGQPPLPVPPGRFTAAGFLDALEVNSGPPPRYVSLVPTQLARLFAPDAVPAVPALRTFAAILVGGAPCPADLLKQARDCGINLVQTYGAAETAGGCVYDGLPLDDTTVKLNDHGQIMVSSPTLALGYAQSDPPATLGLNDHGQIMVSSPTPTPDHAQPDSTSTSDHAQPNPPTPLSGFSNTGGERWFTTNDLGKLDSDGRLVVLGRADDVIICGGLKIVPQQVEIIIKTIPGIEDAVVIGLPDQDWGHRPTALIVTKPGVNIGLEKIRQVVGDQAGPAARPHQILTVPALPLLPSGKIDRTAAAQTVFGACRQRVPAATR